MFVTVNKPRSVSTGEGGGLLGQPRKSRNPISMLNVETVRCLGVEPEREIDGSLMGSNPENTSSRTRGLRGVKQMFQSSPTVHQAMPDRST